jgi:putative DNA primase/helicase
VPFSPDYFFVNAIPTKYVKGTISQLWLKFISEVMDPQDVLVAQEYVGFMLYRYYLFERLLMLTGSGANGKSVFLSTITEMLGRKNITSISMVEIETSSFSRSNLYGKLANIFDDLPATALKTTGYLKQVTGRSLISAERKFHDMFNFINYAKLVFACNAVPKCPDDTDAFFRRWLQINFPKVFLENDPKTDKDLTAKLTKPEELSGILNWAIEGLLRLLKNKRFSAGKSIEETREQYIRSTDPVQAFGMDMIISSPGNLIKKDDVYRLFITYCKQHKLPTVSSRTFSSSQQDAMTDITIQTEYKFENKTRTPYWRDIAISSINNEIDNTDNSDNSHIPVAELKNKINSEKTILQNKKKGSDKLSELSDLSAFMQDNGQDEAKNEGS